MPVSTRTSSPTSFDNGILSLNLVFRRSAEVLPGRRRRHDRRRRSAWLKEHEGRAADGSDRLRGLELFHHRKVAHRDEEIDSYDHWTSRATAPGGRQDGDAAVFIVRLEINAHVLRLGVATRMVEPPDLLLRLLGRVGKHTRNRDRRKGQNCLEKTEAAGVPAARSGLLGGPLHHFAVGTRHATAAVAAAIGAALLGHIHAPPD